MMYKLVIAGAIGMVSVEQAYAAACPSQSDPANVISGSACDCAGSGDGTVGSYCIGQVLYPKCVHDTVLGATECACPSSGDEIATTGGWAEGNVCTKGGSAAAAGSFGAPAACTAANTPYTGCDNTCTDVNTPYAGCTVPACTTNDDTPYTGCDNTCTDVNTPYAGCTVPACTAVDTPYAGCTAQTCTAVDTPYAGCTVPACTAVDTPYAGCTAVSGKCSGNLATATNLAEEAADGTFQYACGASYNVKASTVALSGANAAAMKTACCSPVTCSNTTGAAWVTAACVCEGGDAIDAAAATCAVKSGGTNNGCAAASANSNTCLGASKGSCAVTSSGTNSDCDSAATSADCTAATASGGGSDAANACVFTATDANACEYTGAITAESAGDSCDVENGGKCTAGAAGQDAVCAAAPVAPTATTTPAPAAPAATTTSAPKTSIDPGTEDSAATATLGVASALAAAAAFARLL